MKQKSKSKIIIFLIIAALAASAAGIWYFSDFSSPEKRLNLSPDLRFNLYNSEELGFSFQYPPNFVISSFEEGEATIILATATSTDASFQIYITAFDEPGDMITAERVQQDIPDIIINDPQEITIGGLAKGISFISESPEGSTSNSEIWFAHTGWLYQITAPLSDDTLLQRVLNMWKFE
ncbi:hypothetical protein A2924_03000 [Candidatus Giovannonibacteria bacterium RIFCSPLOWO2_01_FULL_44_16]|uniref:DUF4367 domain-containing protein n=1 Tax=Candidatus Giovannonibacteria bacterium RIFCSPLOWO2_01_FULL_44_16 TaxID=1798348 RepID=A0A1F5X2Q5_9BACT|nr:MAG: hypothetical protein A2924_03000 [Candidatus Giovannonibacteria bacterium RIFCSPLOWO2_01_FULL_44_16]